MVDSIPIDILRQAVGTSITNSRGITLGELIEITSHEISQQPEYLILRSRVQGGTTARFFAIPVFSHLIIVTGEKEIRVAVDLKELRLAKRIPANQCPHPEMEGGDKIYELYRYKKQEKNLNSKGLTD